MTRRVDPRAIARQRQGLGRRNALDFQAPLEPPAPVAGCGGSPPRAKRAYDVSNRPRRSSKASGSQDPRYDSPEWFALRALVLREQPRCQGPCGGYYASRFCDHIVAEKDGGDFWDRKNLQALCDRCHRQKSRIEQGERGELSRVRRTGPAIKGCDAHGMPLDPNHPWNQE